jgi:hypothetical protein
VADVTWSTINRQGAARPQARPDRFDDLFVTGWERNGDCARRRTGARAFALDREVDRPVPVVGGQDLVARTQTDGLQDDRDARGGVGDQCRALGIGAEKGGQMPAGMCDAVTQPDRVEARRVVVHLVAQALLHTLDGDRHRAERAVVQVRDARIEREQQARGGDRRRRTRLGRASMAVSPVRRRSAPAVAAYPSLKSRYTTASTAFVRSGSRWSDGTRNGMPALRIFCSARNSRCDIVRSGTRNARAISAVVRPTSARRVRTTCA